MTSLCTAQPSTNCMFTFKCALGWIYKIHILTIALTSLSFNANAFQHLVFYSDQWLLTTKSAKAKTSESNNIKLAGLSHEFYKINIETHFGFEFSLKMI